MIDLFCRTFLLCLQLNRVPLNNEYLRLPRELIDAFASVAAHPNMSKELVSAMQRTCIDLNFRYENILLSVN